MKPKNRLKNGEHNLLCISLAMYSFPAILQTKVSIFTFRVIKKYVVKKGANFSTKASKLAADLTADMLARYCIICTTVLYNERATAT